MDTQTLMIVAVAVVLVAAVGAWTYARRRRTERLRGRFGLEYDRLVSEYGRPRAEAAMVKRDKRLKELRIRPLAEAEWARFAQEWRADQARFVVDPPGAVVEADRLVADLMIARGYPMADFEERAADVSMVYPRVVENYRAAHNITARYQHGEASTQDLRQAMVHYRELFADLLSGPTTKRPEADR